MTYVKICGITRVSDAVDSVSAGASAIGLNFVKTSKRLVSLERALEIADAVRGRIEIVAVLSDPSPERVDEIRNALRVDYVQLHGDESPEFLSSLLPAAFKAVAIGTEDDVRIARAFAGERLLVDAKVAGESGGTGATFDWRLVRGLAEERRLVLAGGLRPDNVGAAVRQVRPWGVDVASGVESSPGIKDGEKIGAFVKAAREGTDP